MPELNQKKLSIASRIAVARKNAGLSQAQVGQMMGLHRPSISEIEAGRRHVSSEELVEFAEIFRVKVSWLACQDEDEPDPKKDRIELAARELSKLKEDDLEKVINLLNSLRHQGDKK